MVENVRERKRERMRERVRRKDRDCGNARGQTERESAAEVGRG